MLFTMLRLLVTVIAATLIPTFGLASPIREAEEK